MPQPFYESDLTDAEWDMIRPILPPPKPVGQQRVVDLREILNAIFYRADNGIKWRALPCDFPRWQTVYGYISSVGQIRRMGAHQCAAGATSSSSSRTREPTESSDHR